MSAAQAPMNAYPSVDESYDRLRRAGWSFGHVGTATTWLVSGSNGENLISAEGRTLAEAYWRSLPCGDSPRVFSESFASLGGSQAILQYTRCRSVCRFPASRKHHFSAAQPEAINGAGVRNAG